MRDKAEDALTAVVADDHQLLRAGISKILEDAGLEVVAEAADGLEAISLAKMHRPALLTLDIAMPFAQGIAVYAEVKRWSPETRVVVFTGVTSISMMAELVENGVEGLFMKRGDIDEFERAIPLIMGGAKVIAQEALVLLKEDAGCRKLTVRERQILSLVASGHTTKGIAERLNVSAKTVDNHRTNIMAKLEVRSMAELLAYALREGLLEAQREL